MEEKLVEATKPSVVNINLVTANKEYMHKLPVGCKRFRIQMRDSTDFRLAVFQDIVAKPNPGYYTVKGGAAFEERSLNIQEETWLYIACGSDNKIVEIFQWT